MPLTAAEKTLASMNALYGPAGLAPQGPILRRRQTPVCLTVSASGQSRKSTRWQGRPAARATRSNTTRARPAPRTQRRAEKGAPPDHHRPQHGQLPKGPRASRHHGPTGPAAAAGSAAGFAFGADAESFWRARPAKSLSPLAPTSRSRCWPPPRTLPKLEPMDATPHSYLDFESVGFYGTAFCGPA